MISFDFLILVIMLSLLLIKWDCFSFGFLPKFLKIWPALDSSLGTVLVDQPLSFSYKKNFNFKVWGFRTKPDYKDGLRLLLTTNSLLIKNTQRTYIWKIDVQSIKYYEIKKSILRNGIIFHFDQDSQSCFINFKTFKLNEWLKNLSELGIKEIAEYDETTIK